MLDRTSGKNLMCDETEKRKKKYSDFFNSCPAAINAHHSVIHGRSGTHGILSKRSKDEAYLFSLKRIRYALYFSHFVRMILYF